MSAAAVKHIATVLADLGRQGGQLSPFAQAVALQLAIQVDKASGRCCLLQSDLTARAGLSRSGVKRALVELEKAGIVRRLGRNSPGGPCTYQVPPSGDEGSDG